VVRKIKERQAQIRPLIPADIKTEIVGDQSTFIQASVDNVKEHLVLGAILAALMVLLFMGDFRSTVISALAIPVSLIGTFIFMQIKGFTINEMTLLGLMVAVGIVIDDAIIMLENIYRHMEELGQPPKEAAMKGSDEIGFAVIATSLSLLVIFIPLAYISGIVGRVIKSYGLTIAFAIGVSIVVALTLTPMLCSGFLRVKSVHKPRFVYITDAVNDFLARYYLVSLKWAMARRKFMVVASAIVMFSSIPLLMFIGKDFIPQDDTSKFQVAITAPEGTSIEMMKQIFSQLEKEYRRLPCVENLATAVGISQDLTGTASTNKGTITIELAGLSRRKIPMKEIMSAAREMTSKYSSLRVSVQPIGGFGGGHADFDFVISGPDLAKLQEYAAAVAGALRKTKGLVDVDTSFSYAQPEYRIEIERSRAHDLGVKVEDIATSLRTLVGGEEDITKFKEGDELYQVRLRADQNYRDRPEAIRALMVPAGDNAVVRLDSVATVKEGLGPTQIQRYNRKRQITVSANLEGMPLGTALGIAQSAYDGLKAPAEYKGEAGGRSKELGRMLSSFLTAFLLAFLFIYMILASQFESFIYPISIIVALPLTLPFALLSLFMTGQNLSLYSIMGLFLLIGIVKKNAILQVDYTNTLRSRGMERYPAILEANKTRLRPIIMTTLTLIASMIPTAFGTGVGAATRRAMAWVIIGGQALSLLITLLMTPVIYSLLDDLQEWLKKKPAAVPPPQS